LLTLFSILDSVSVPVYAYSGLRAEVEGAF
jgi:hypothetical protein